MGRHYWNCPTCGTALAVADPPGSSPDTARYVGTKCASCAAGEKNETDTAAVEREGVASKKGAGDHRLSR